MIFKQDNCNALQSNKKKNNEKKNATNECMKEAEKKWGVPKRSLNYNIFIPLTCALSHCILSLVMLLYHVEYLIFVDANCDPRQAFHDDCSFVIVIYASQPTTVRPNAKT